MVLINLDQIIELINQNQGITLFKFDQEVQSWRIGKCLIMTDSVKLKIENILCH